MARIPTGDMPYGVPGWPDGFAATDHVKFAEPMTIEDARWWSQTFKVGDRPLYPTNIAERLARGLPGKLNCFISAVIPAQGRVSLELHGVDDSMNRLWFLGETLWFEPDRHMFSDLVEVTSSLQGRGLGKRMMRNCFDLATDLALDDLRLKASWAGTYAWLKFGFVPTKKDWEGELKVRLTERLLEFNSQISRSTFNQMLKLLGSDNPRAAWLIADEATLVQVVGQNNPVKLGRALLAYNGAPWNGILKIGDLVSEQRFKDYLESEQ